MQTVNCAICKSKEKTSVLFAESINFTNIDQNTFSARRIPEKVHYRLLRCLNCGLVFSSPILPEDKIKLLYRESELTYESEIPSLKETYGYYLQKALPFLPTQPKLLEIGCGNGFFLEKAKELGINKVYGIEPSVSAVKKAKKNLQKSIIIDFFPTKKIHGLSFDIICIFQTLDHIIDPNLFLQACNKILKDGGIVLAIVHDTHGLSVKLLGERSPIFDIEHIYLFNKNTLKKIFEKNGFSSIEIFDVANDYPLFYWLRMFPIPQKVKIYLLKFLKLSRFDKISLKLKAGNIGIIAKKKSRK